MVWVDIRLIQRKIDEKKEKIFQICYNCQWKVSMNIFAFLELKAITADFSALNDMYRYLIMNM